LRFNVVLPILIFGLTLLVAGRQNNMTVNFLLSLVIVAPIGLYLYRIAYQPIATPRAGAAIRFVGVHLAMQAWAGVLRC